MDTLEFVSAVIGHIAWPLTVILAIFAFKGPISDLIPFLQRLRYKDFVVEFSQKVGEIENQVAAITGNTSEVQVEDEILELSQAHPRGAIIDSWLAVEKAIHDVASSRNNWDVEPIRGRSILSIERGLANSRVITPQLASLLRELRSTRNEVVHNQDVPLTPEMARQYASAASGVVVALVALGSDPPRKG